VELNLTLHMATQKRVFSGFFFIRGATGLAIYGLNAATSNFHIVGKNIFT
jgi:hypothetical protein